VVTGWLWFGKGMVTVWLRGAYVVVMGKFLVGYRRLTWRLRGVYRLVMSWLRGNCYVVVTRWLWGGYGVVMGGYGVASGW